MQITPIRLLALILVPFAASSCGGGGGGGVGGMDVTPPHVSATIPPNGATGYDLALVRSWP
jgi:hypothetical protein